MQLYQQGDVLLKTCARLPQHGRQEPDTILAHGEATGHRHVAVGDGAVLYALEGRRFLSAPSGATIVHEEHQAITIPPGVYEIGVVREYDHFAEEAREVRD